MAMTKLSDYVTYHCSSNQSTWNLDQNVINVLIVRENQRQHKDARWHELRSPNTKPYERWLLKFLVNSTVVDVANKLDISSAKVAGVLDRWVATKVNWEEFKRIEILGIDEIAWKRGHRDYVVLITTPSTLQGVEVLAVLPDRKKETVVKFFASIPIKLRQTIERVCTALLHKNYELAEIIIESNSTNPSEPCQKKRPRRAIEFGIGASTM